MSRYLSKYFEVFVCLHKSNRRKGSTFGNRRRSVRGLADIRGRARGKQPPQGPLDKGPCGGYNNSHRAGVVQRPVHQPSKLRTRVRLPSPAPYKALHPVMRRFFFVSQTKCIGSVLFSQKTVTATPGRCPGRFLFVCPLNKYKKFTPTAAAFCTHKRKMKNQEN